MPISLSKLVATNVTTLRVDVGLPEPIKVVTRQNQITGRFVQEIRDCENNGDIEGMCTKLTEVLASWDVEDDDGEPLPITAANLMAIPLQVLRAITEVMVAELNPQKRNSGR